MRVFGKAEQAIADILRAFENPATLPPRLAQVFIHRKDGSPCREWSWRNQLGEGMAVLRRDPEHPTWIAVQWHKDKVRQLLEDVGWPRVKNDE